MLERIALQVITAGKADEVVADLGGPRPNHSIFTGHFLNALDGAAADKGVLTANGVMAYVYQQVGTDEDSNQTPHYGYLDGDGDFIFNPPAHDQIDSDELKGEDKLIAIPGADSDSESSQAFSIIDCVKALIPNSEDRISLHDLVVKETRAVLAEISTDMFKVQGKWSEEEFDQRVTSYNKATEQLRTIQMLLGYWGTRTHHEIITLPTKRIAEQVTLGSGLRIWMALRWYPVSVLMYSCGLGAVSSHQYSNLYVLLHSKLPDERKRHGTTTVLQSLYHDYGLINDGFKTLPGHERQYVPVSEYLFKELQPLADEVLFLGSDYELQFDRLEVLISLECASIEGGWGPIGRFGWKHKSRGVEISPLDALIAEAEAAGDNWEPIQGGFFSGSIDKFKTAVEKYKPMIENLSWH